MKVLHIITGLGVGGAELQLRSVIQHSRHDGEVVTLYNPGPVADMLREDGVRVRSLEMASNRQLSALPRLWRLIRQGHYDVVHAHLYRSQIYGRPGRPPRGGPGGGQHRAFDWRDPSGAPADDRRSTCPVPRHRDVLRHDHRGLGDGPATDDHWGVPAKKVIDIPNGVDLDRVAFDETARKRIREEFGSARMITSSACWDASTRTSDSSWSSRPPRRCCAPGCGCWSSGRVTSRPGWRRQPPGAA